MTVESWNRDAPPGFQGLHPDIRVTVYHRHLPHWRQDGATYFVTFRLADSLPQGKLHELESRKREFAAGYAIRGTDWRSVLRRKADSIPREAWEAFCQEQMQRIEEWLDQGMGSCCLKRPDIANTVVDSLHHFDDDTYELGSYVVMPNHVHAIMRPLKPKTDPLEKILQGRKRHMSRRNQFHTWTSGRSFGRKKASTASFAMKNISIVAFSISAPIRGEPVCQGTLARGGCGQVGEPSDGTFASRDRRRTDCQSVLQPMWHGLPIRPATHVGRIANPSYNTTHP